MAAIEPELAALGAHLATRRDAIMDAWRQALRRDPALTTGDSLPRAQLNDHIPALLLTFEKRLAGGCSTAAGLPGSQESNQAAAHGLHRWQQGYDLREVARELGRLNECMVAELDACVGTQPARSPAAMTAARSAWAELCGISIGESTAQYFRLQQSEAAGHMGDLEQALEQIRELEKERADLWHQAAHDLRGNLGVVVSATAILGRPAAPEATRTKFLGVLERNVKSLHHLLDDVMDLARLQAGRERRQLAAIDAGALLRELCEGLEPHAAQKNLTLRFDGPLPFMVEGDTVKIRRMTQNLVLNAVKYTVQGGVAVTWGDSDAGDDKRWMVRVQDTGPGFQGGPSAPLAGVLEDATGLARESEAAARNGTVSMASAMPHAAPDRRREPRPLQLEPGEGIGLSIVKRLAELLDASIEMEPGAQGGTIFRIFLPRRYAG